MAQSDDRTGGEPTDDVARHLETLTAYHRREGPDEPFGTYSLMPPERKDLAVPAMEQVREYVSGEREQSEVPTWEFKTAVICGPFLPPEDGERPVSAFALRFPWEDGDPAVAWVADPADHTRGEWRAMSSLQVYASRVDPEDLTTALRDSDVTVVMTRSLWARWDPPEYRDLHPDADDGADGDDAPEDGGSTNDQTDPNTTLTNEQSQTDRQRTDWK